MESSGSWLASLYLCIWDFSAPSLQSVCTLHHTAAGAPLWFGCSHPCHHLWWPADLLPSWISETRSRYRADMWCCELHWHCSSPSVWIRWLRRCSRRTVACLCASVKDTTWTCEPWSNHPANHFNDWSHDSLSVWHVDWFLLVTVSRQSANIWQHVANVLT